MASILKRPTPQGLTYQARIRVRGLSFPFRHSLIGRTLLK